MSAADAAAVGNTLYCRLGPLFMEFKGRPSLCAMYPAIKLASRVAKGALLGLFYGRLCSASLVGHPGLSGYTVDAYMSADYLHVCTACVSAYGAVNGATPKRCLLARSVL
jgi:hypothetical protein